MSMENVVRVRLTWVKENNSWKGLLQHGTRLGILLLTAALYAPALRFGFWWDDPLWYGRVVGASFWQLLLPLGNFQFYRPGTMLINALFARTDGTFPAVIMHAFQVGVHLLNAALMVRVGRLLGLSAAVVTGAMALFALYPLGHQAIVWTAPQQAWVILLLLAALWAYLEARRMRRTAWQWAAVGLYAAALLVQESALQLMPVLLWLEWRERRTWRERWRAPLLWACGLLSLGYLYVWTQVPRLEGITRVAFEGRVAAYLLQGLAFPALGFPQGFPDALRPYVPYVLAVVMVGLSLLLWRKRAVLWGGLLWFGAALASTWAGLEYDYVSLSPRLFYLAAPGAAVLWAAALHPPQDASRLRRGVSWLLLLLVWAQSALLIGHFNRAYAVGAAHLAEMVDVLDPATESRRLFVNFPDRYTFRQEPYPWGYWGVTLAPVVTPLEDFARMHHGRAPETISLSVPALAATVGPYRVDIRGAPVDEAAVYQAARETGGTYLTQYRDDGAFELVYAGDVWKETAAAPPLVRFGEIAELLAATCDYDGNVLRVTLRWRVLQPGAYTEVVFVHLGQSDSAPLAQDDGAPGHGLFPLWTWQSGDVVEEVRTLPAPAATLPPGEYGIDIGIYDWQAQGRQPVYRADGTLWPAAAFPAGELRVGDKTP